MRFAGQTLEVESGALFHFSVVRSESPSADRFVCPKLCDETRERDRSVGGIADAGSRADGRIERSGITVVANINVQ